MLDKIFDNLKLELRLKCIAGFALLRLAFLPVFLLATAGLIAASAQTEAKPPTAPRTPVYGAPVPVPSPIPKAKVWKKQPLNLSENESDSPAEKVIKTDEKVLVLIPCVTEGTVKINGWDRKEVRAYVDGGTEVGFNILQSKAGNPVWVKVIGFDPGKRQTGETFSECLSGDEIELDVPRGATIDFTGQESEIEVVSVNKVKINNVSGSINLRDIAQGVYAVTREGDVTLQNSSGAITLISTNGNIVAFETQANEIGDAFLAKTNSGTITLQNVEQRQIQTNSISGSLRYNGELASGGQYDFRTTNGSINLFLPVDASCKIKASYGGSFQSELPLKDIVKTPSQLQSLTGNLGSGDANLLLTTFGGAIRIRKQ